MSRLFVASITPIWIPAEKHQPENAGKNKVEVIIVELKGKTGAK